MKSTLQLKKDFIKEVLHKDMSRRTENDINNLLASMTGMEDLKYMEWLNNRRITRSIDKVFKKYITVQQ